ncbi:hypothetical protein [Yeosuana marina]|uniref:hypothetical protein n=1 Tax=Yeosuana marina TaxID=1565536 RepID=UPI0030C846DD
MKIIIEKFILGLLIALAFSCSTKYLSESEETVKTFFKAVKENKIEGMEKSYENINLFDTYYKSDSIQILKSSKLNDSTVRVKIKNYFTNGFGKLTNKEILFFVSSDSTKSFTRIIDSKGLTNHKDNDFYDFARKVGCLKDSDTSDVEINLKLLEVKPLARKLQMETLLDFMTNVKIVNWSWESGYGGSASGKGIIKNNTTFSIPKIKYVVKYLDKGGNVLTTDDGYVSYDKIDYGESKSFTFYTSYIGNASRASIMLDFDDDMIKEYVLNTKEYEGNEYEKYINTSE